MDPTLALTNAGVDTNVFNDADDANPQSDFTVTISPKTDLWMRLGRTWVQGVINEDIVWYRKFANQRSANNDYKVNWIVPLTRVAFSIGGDWLSAKDRPGFEIDITAAQRERRAYSTRGGSPCPVGDDLFAQPLAYSMSATTPRDVFLGANLDTELTNGIRDITDLSGTTHAAHESRRQHHARAGSL